MRSDNILIYLRNDMKRASNIQLSYIVSDNETSDINEIDLFDKDNILINYNEKDFVFYLDNLKVLDEGINCEGFCGYTLENNISDRIIGYVDSVIVILKINFNVYKIDATIEQLNQNTNTPFETNMQCVITLRDD